jgi:nitrous oxide reductase
MLIEKNKSIKGGSLMNRRKFTIALGTATAGLVAGSALFGQDATTTKAKKKAKHDCAGKNTCKGQGGCKTGDNGCSGKNSCKGKGGCAVPPKKS